MKAKKNDHLSYNEKLKNFSRSNRKQSTKAEVCLWKFALRAKTMRGYAFNRQRPVMNYIADFMCKELKLIIEIDGFTHLFKSVQKKDKLKQHVLEKAGFTFLRFNDKEVLTDIGFVMDKISNVIDYLEGLPPPSAKADTPSIRGG